MYHHGSMLVVEVGRGMQRVLSQEYFSASKINHAAGAAELSCRANSP